MDINSLQAGTSIAYSQGNAAVDISSQNNGVVEEKQASTDQKAAKLTVSLSEIDNTKVNQQSADNSYSQGYSQEELEAALTDVAEFVQAKNQDLSFSFDDEANRSIIKVTDTESGDVIRQIPSEEVIKLSERIRDLQTDVGNTVGTGVLVNNEV
jgi:flagellar protein FlaG